MIVPRGRTPGHWSDVPPIGPPPAATGRPFWSVMIPTYEADDAFRHEDAAGFVRLWGLSVETWSRRQRTEEPAVPKEPRDG